MNITYLLFQALFLSYVLFFSSLPVVTTADSTAAVIVENPKIDKLKLQSGFKADAIFLDPFSPPQCPHLWTIEFLQLVSQCLQSDGLLATYSCAASVRTALVNTGLSISSTSPVGRKAPGTVAGFNISCCTGTETNNSNSPVHKFPDLSQREKEHLLTRAAVPYRDPELTDTPETIIQRRKLEQQTSDLEATSHWRKRWFNVY